MQIAILLVSFLSFQTFYLSAQTYFRFADTNAIWNLQEIALLEGPSGISSNFRFNQYEVTGDTFLNNTQYQKIEAESNRWEMISPALVRRDSTDKIFIYDFDLQAERLIYDFSVVVGDTVEYYTIPEFTSDTMKFKVDSIDYVEIDTLQKRIFLSNISINGWSLIIIDGVGCFNSHFLSPLYLEYSSIPGDGFCLMSYSTDSLYDFSENCDTSTIIGVRDISNQARLKVYPNPSSDYINFLLESPKQQIESISILDLNGKEVIKSNETRIDVQSLASGIYFYSVDLDNNQFVRGRFLKE